MSKQKNNKIQNEKQIIKNESTTKIKKKTKKRNLNMLDMVLNKNETIQKNRKNKKIKQKTKKKQQNKTQNEKHEKQNWKK